MVEQEQKEQNAQKNVFELSKELRDILDEVLTTGDWQSSIFLKTAANKLRAIRDKSDNLFNSGNVATVVNTNASKDIARKPVPPGYSQVFVLLYQVDSANLQGWHRNIKTLADYSVTRPVYKDENHAKEVIRSKTMGVDRNGYAVVNVKDSDFSESENQTDQFGHPLFILKQGAVKLENIVEFIHCNVKRYAMRDNELVYLNEI